MLKHLRLCNFAIVDELDVEFSDGLVAITGETGAGKSVLVHALEFALGGRANAEALRHDADRAVVEASFDVERCAEIGRVTSELGASVQEDELLVLRREMRSDGKGRAWINGVPVQARDLRRLGEGLVDIHGQHEHQSLLKPPAHRVLLDAYAGAEGVADRVAGLRRSLDDIEGRLQGLERAQEDRSGKIDFLRYQIDEIERASLSLEEEAELEAEKRRLVHAESLAGLVQSSVQCLAGDDSESSGSRDLLARAADLLEEAAGLDPELDPPREACVQAFAQVEEALTRLQGYADSLDHDPQRLDEVEGRLALISRLKRKYNGNVAEILSVLDALRSEWSQLSGAEESLPVLRRERSEALERLVSSSDDLSSARSNAGERLSAHVSRELKDLGLERSRFEVSLQREPGDVPSPNGWESVEFLFTAHPGEPSRPLRSVASGGELSRVMMALKSVLAHQDKIPTLIFDEVDANVGGRLGVVIGGKLRGLASSRQVLCITHLAQIAAVAHHHLKVSKDVSGPRPSVSIEEMKGESRVREIAHMIAGESSSDVTLQQARELLGSSEEPR